MASVSDRPRAVHQRQPARPSHGVARLTLFINGVAYHVRPIPVTGAIATRLYLLRKPDGTTHFVASTLDGLSCDCDDHTFHRDSIDPDGCQHIKALVAVRLLDSRKAVAQ
jgi:hypothetical protein